MTNINVLNKGIVGAIILLLLLVATVPMLTNAQASTCRVRATVTTGEAREISGNQSRGSVNAGNDLMLTGPQAGENALICGFALIKWVANVVFAVLIAIAILMIAYGAFLFVTAGGKPSNVQTAKKVMLWAIIGLIVASIAKLIPNIASSILGFN